MTGQGDRLSEPDRLSAAQVILARRSHPKITDPSTLTRVAAIVSGGRSSTPRTVAGTVKRAAS